jgi:hypothetical protein
MVFMAGGASGLNLLAMTLGAGISGDRLPVITQLWIAGDFVTAEASRTGA